MEKRLFGIKSRSEKAKDEQIKRSKEKAEVFTPTWVCNKQNNLIDDVWFGEQNVFNIEDGNNWKSTKKVNFAEKNWQEYIKDLRLEIACGEAPYITSRYDMITGKNISVKKRIGFLDRKLRVVSENTNTRADWINTALVAIKSVYGYEFQGDSLFIARKNILFDFIEFYSEKFKEFPSSRVLKEVAQIISWNVWQMDGLKLVIPFSCRNSSNEQLDIFGKKHIAGKHCIGCEKKTIENHNGIKCLIMDWEKNKKVKFAHLMKGESK